MIATIAELWRYPVKGMRGERLSSLQLDEHGIAGDRRWAVRSSGAPRGKPMLSGAERAAMLLFSASGDGDSTAVTTPDGARFSIHDPALLAAIAHHLPGEHSLQLVRSQTPMTDVRPIAMLGYATVRQLGQELGRPVDARRFRANLLLDFPPANEGFAEDGLVGRSIRLGADAILHITERDPRCRIVTLDPETAAADPALMKHLDRHHEGRVGVYATVETMACLRVGDPVRLP
ncbi:hypothetical protein SAMN05443244_1690 [Terriglobus roseus]|uniref:MOSC domain-containing protein n=2 Tax=Terriglobus roseus TaxID=392734 RepID=A0A1H4LR95_9BACT|nr:hypothetical protein SAMN05443244_1690 [Terriglobus roseus]